MPFKPITFADSNELMQHDRSTGRFEKVMANGVTIAAVTEDGKVQWEAHDASGKVLPGFCLKIDRPDDVTALHPIYIDSPAGCFFCYEDEDAQQSVCNPVPC